MDGVEELAGEIKAGFVAGLSTEAAGFVVRVSPVEFLVDLNSRPFTVPMYKCMGRCASNLSVLGAVCEAAHTNVDSGPKPAKEGGITNKVVFLERSGSSAIAVGSKWPLDVLRETVHVWPHQTTTIHSADRMLEPAPNPALVS